MSFGFHVTNQADQVQIDGDYSNLAFITKGTVNPTTRFGIGNASSMYYANVTLTGVVAPVIALRASGSNRVTLYNVFDEGGGQFICQIVSENQGAPIEYYVFDVSENHLIGGGQYGLVVADAAGEKRYDSRFKSFRVVDFLHYPRLEATDSQSYSVEKIGVVCGRVSRRYRAEIVGAQPIVQGYLFSMAMMLSTPTAASLSISQGVIWAFVTDNPESFYFTQFIVDNSYFMVVDLTGF